MTRSRREEVVDVGRGPALVLIPGIQGRWEYLQPAIDALAESFRVLSFHLSGERVCSDDFDLSLGLENYTRQVASVLDRAQVEQALICGISFGGLVALRFAATEPGRTSALVLASAPGPDWHLRPRHHVYTRAPWVFGPLFLAETPWRLRIELATTFPDWKTRLAFGAWQVRTLARSGFSPTQMALRATLISDSQTPIDLGAITAPTLIITGEPNLDRVVAVEGTKAYLKVIAGAQYRVLEGTGHLGSITRPTAFASIIRRFVDQHSESRPTPARGARGGDSDAA